MHRIFAMNTPIKPHNTMEFYHNYRIFKGNLSHKFPRNFHFLAKIHKKYLQVISKKSNFYNIFSSNPKTTISWGFLRWNPTGYLWGEFLCNYGWFHLKNRLPKIPRLNPVPRAADITWHNKKLKLDSIGITEKWLGLKRVSGKKRHTVVWDSIGILKKDTKTNGFFWDYRKPQKKRRVDSIGFTEGH